MCVFGVIPRKYKYVLSWKQGQNREVTWKIKKKTDLFDEALVRERWRQL